MAKQQREVWLALETAQSALSVLETFVAAGHDDRKTVNDLIGRAREAVDTAQDRLTDALRDAQNAIDRI